MSYGRERGGIGPLVSIDLRTAVAVSGGFSWKGKLDSGGQLRSTGELPYNELGSSYYLERMDRTSNLTSASWSATA